MCYNCTVVAFYIYLAVCNFRYRSNIAMQWQAYWLKLRLESKNNLHANLLDYYCSWLSYTVNNTWILDKGQFKPRLNAFVSYLYWWTSQHLSFIRLRFAIGINSPSLAIYRVFAQREAYYVTLSTCHKKNKAFES